MFNCESRGTEDRKYWEVTGQEILLNRPVRSSCLFLTSWVKVSSPTRDSSINHDSLVNMKLEDQPNREDIGKDYDVLCF